MRLNDDKQYQRPEFTEQDLISSDNQLIKEKLKDYIQVDPKFNKDIPCGTWIKYVTHNGLYRTGGVLVKNGSPDYLVLRNNYKKLSWSVDLKKNYIFIEDIKKKKESKMEKDNLYKLYQNGFIKILEEPE